MNRKQNGMHISMQNERWYLRSPNINICFKAGITSIIDKEEFCAAVESICKRHPILNATVFIDDENIAWYKLDSGNIVIEFFDSRDGMTWEKWYEETDNIPFDFQKGPLVKIGVFYGSIHTDIVLLGHHILSDGIGYLNLMNDLLKSLDACLDESPQIPPLINGLKNVKFGFLPKLYAHKLNKTWASNRHVFSESEYLMFFKTYREKYPPGMLLATLQNSKMVSLFSFCKKNGITVNEAIAAAFSGAMQEIGLKELRLGVAASVRNELKSPVSGCMGNYVTGISVEVAYNNKESFLENARSIAKSLREKLGNLKSRHIAINFLNEMNTDFIESMVYATYWNYDNPESNKLAELMGERTSGKGIGISNLGRQNMGAFNRFELVDVIFIPPAYPANLLTIGVMTVNERLGFCLRYTKSELSEADIEKIYLKAVSFLV